MIQIAVINQSTVVSDNDAAKMVAAIQKQVSRDFAPVWDLEASLTFISKAQPKPLPAGAWPCYLLDTADVPGALGYHDEGTTAKPFGRVFAKTTLADGEKVSVTLSHEILEMLGDPYVRLGVFVEARTGGGGRFYAYETADACEADEYLIDGVAVSDFVTPAYFDPSPHAKGTKFDYLGKITRPFQIAPGGYLSVLDVPGGAGWQQITASEAQANGHAVAALSLPKPGSRRERRRPACPSAL